MTTQRPGAGLSLFDAARAAGIPFATETQPQDRFVQANDLRFHYLSWGDPGGPPVLLLHGFAQTCHSWDFVALSLCERFHVIALDQRGHGDSEWAPDGDYSPQSHRQDIDAIAEKLELHGLVLMGLSMGGRNAVAFAAAHPERVRALVIVDAAPVTQLRGAQRIRRFAQGDDELDSIDDFVERVRRYNPLRPVQQIRGSIVHNLKQLPSGKWTWKYDRVLRDPARFLASSPEPAQRMWQYVDSIECATLVVRGAESDVVAPETAEAMAERIQRGRLVTIESAGHLVIGDNPAGFLRAVGDFLAALD